MRICSFTSDDPAVAQLSPGDLSCRLGRKEVMPARGCSRECENRLHNATSKEENKRRPGDQPWVVTSYIIFLTHREAAISGHGEVDKSGGRRVFPLSHIVQQTPHSQEIERLLSHAHIPPCDNDHRSPVHFLHGGAPPAGSPPDQRDLCAIEGKLGNRRAKGG